MRSYEFHLLVAAGEHHHELSFSTIGELTKKYKELKAEDEAEAEPKKKVKKGGKK